MNIFHYVLIAFVLLGLFLNKSIQKQGKKIVIVDKAGLISTIIIIAIIILSAYW